MTFKAKATMWFKEVDNWEQGCQMEGGKSGMDGSVFKADTLPALIALLNEHTGNKDMQNVLMNSCDEKGRIDIQVYENERGTPMTKAHEAKWKEGKAIVYLACYTFRVERIEEVDLDAPEFKIEGATYDA